MKADTMSLLLAGPVDGTDVRQLVSDYKRLAGVVRIARGETVPRLLRIEYDSRLVAAEALLVYARRRWRRAQLVSGGAASGPVRRGLPASQVGGAGCPSF
jgi:hypothetical protein